MAIVGRAIRQKMRDDAAERRDPEGRRLDRERIQRAGELTRQDVAAKFGSPLDPNRAGEIIHYNDERFEHHLRVLRGE